MVVFDVVVELPMDADEYLRVKDSAAYKAFHCEKNGTANEYLSDETVDGERRTVTRTIPNIAIPWALRRAILGNKRVEFIDRRRWREGSHLTAPFTQHFHTTNNISDRCVVQGTVTVEPHGPGRCVITVRGECVVEVKGLGGKIEQLIVNNLRGSYEKVPAVIAEWLAISGHHDTKPDTSFAEAPAEFTSLDLGPPTPPDDDIENGFEKDIENGFQKNHPYTNGALPRQQSYAFDRDEYRESSISMIESTFETPSRRDAVTSPNKHESFLHPTPVFTRFTGLSRGRSLLSSRKPGVGIRGRRKGGRDGTLGVYKFFLAVAIFWLCAVGYYVTGWSNSTVPTMGHGLDDAGREAAIAKEMAAGRAARDRAYALHREQHEAATTQGDSGRDPVKLDAGSALVTKETVETVAPARQPDAGCADARREECENWACTGECESNPSFMAKSCPCACEAVRHRSDSSSIGKNLAFETDASRGVALGFDWTDTSGAHRVARVRVKLDPADAPGTTAALRSAVAKGTCAPGSTICGGACHLHRAEKGYGLVQGNLAGLELAGGRFEDGRTEGIGGWSRGTVGYIPGGPNILIATTDHAEWDKSFTAFGRVVDSDMAAIDELLELPTTPFVHPEYKTTMAMLVTKVRYTLEGATDV